MKLRHLKPLRVVVSILFFMLIGLVFLDFRNIGVKAIAKKILYLQFVPSLVEFLGASILGAAGFMVITVLTLLFGRVYCSTICPLGTYQDVIGYLVKRKRGRLKWKAPHNRLRYAILTLTALSFIAGSSLLLNLLDPFSSFGRILSNLIRPMVLGINNGVAIALEQFDIHLLYQVQWSVTAPLSVGISLTMLGLVTWLSAKQGRLYCNTVCPVGALLGLFSNGSLFQIGFVSDRCNGCKRCETVCKANCIDSKQQTIDFSRCVGCYNCFAICKEQALYFESRWRKTNPAAPRKNGRRDFIANSVIWITGLASGTLVPISATFAGARQIIQGKPTTVPVPVTSPVTPPGSVSIEHFTSQCTACHLCVSVCPSRVLVPSLLEYGLSGIMQPRMNFHTGHCNYDCTDCLEVCPSGAILPLDVETKKVSQLGIARFIKENCVVYTDNTNCGACSEHCPTKAVDMVPYLRFPDKELVIPKVNADICIGCGGCEYACPTKPFKAIYVEGNPVHKTAMKPTEEKIKVNTNTNNKFPF